MTYHREIPRDLFNEGSLLKCYGQIFIALETAQVLDVELEHDGMPFDVVHDAGDNSLSLANVKLMVRGKSVELFRPSNSRYAWPLYVREEDGEELEMFNEDGSFSKEMLDFLRRK
jgi:hypothetical protein